MAEGRNQLFAGLANVASNRRLDNLDPCLQERVSTSAGGGIGIGRAEYNPRNSSLTQRLAARWSVARVIAGLQRDYQGRNVVEHASRAAGLEYSHFGVSLAGFFVRSHRQQPAIAPERSRAYRRVRRGGSAKSSRFLQGNSQSLLVGWGDNERGGVCKAGHKSRKTRNNAKLKLQKSKLEA
jgi:hypothetical protein